jgi:hypothetical protein
LYLPFYISCVITAGILDVLIFSFTNKLGYTLHQHILYSICIIASVVTACYVILWGSVAQPMPMSENAFAPQSRLIEMKTGLPSIVILFSVFSVVELTFYLLAEKFFILWCVVIGIGLFISITQLVKKIYRLPEVIYNKRFLVYTQISES